MDRRFRLAACALAMATVSEGAFAAPSAADPSTDYHVEAYEVALRPDVSTTALTGRETIRVAANVDRLEAVAFSPNALAIALCTRASANSASCASSRVSLTPPSRPRSSSSSTAGRRACTGW